MKRLHLTITAQAALAIGQRKPGGSVSEAMDYIPGSAIRGAIAAQILQAAQATAQISSTSADHNQTGDSFQALFLDQTAAVFQNAYPAIAKLEDDRYETRTNVHLLPTTALSSKTNSGFKPTKSGVFDSLIDGFCARAQGLSYEPNDLTGDRVEPFSGFYSQTKQQYCSHTVSKRLLTRVGINRRRATAQEEILYSIEVLDEVQGKRQPHPAVYHGSILIQDDELASQLQQFIDHRQQFRLGGATSRGLGKVEIAVKLEDLPDQTDVVKRRIDSFNEAMGDRWKHWSVFGAAAVNAIAEQTFFTVNLLSDAVLSENWQRTMVISEAMLRQFVGLDPSANNSLTLHTAYSSYDYRSGWNAAWGLPKDLELVTKMGGVYLFSTRHPEQWYEKLAELELLGVGDRTSEGFGQIRVCDEFHSVFRECAV
jgi:CRISPR-associated protein Csx10